MTQATRWQKSSFSGGGDGNTCVELATISGIVHLREGDAPATELIPAPEALAQFLRVIKASRQ